MYIIPTCLPREPESATGPALIETNETNADRRLELK